MPQNNQHDLYLQKSREQKKYYDQTAKDYDRWHTEPASAKIVDAWNFANLKNFIGLHKITRSLDLGCGTGRLANSLLSISTEVYGLDYSQAVIDIAKQKYPALKLSSGQVVNLPYQDNFFDLVLINGSLHHFFATEETLKEVQRVLMPGGFFVLLGEPSSQFMKLYNPFFYIWVIDRIIVKIMAVFKRGKSPQEEIEPEALTFNPTELKQQIEKAGFNVNKFYTYDYFARSENKYWLKKYGTYLNFEARLVSKIFSNLGTAIQSFAIKK